MIFFSSFVQQYIFFTVGWQLQIWTQFNKGPHYWSFNGTLNKILLFQPFNLRPNIEFGFVFHSLEYY